MGNPGDFIIEDGVLTEYRGPDGDVVIPEGVTSIGPSVFSERKNIVSMVIPEGVTFIDERAFYMCDHLQTVSLPESLTTIGNEALYFCWRLKSVSIPENVTSIDYLAFYRCPGLADKDGFVTIGNTIFYYTGTARHITIPNGVTTISNEAFFRCETLVDLFIPEGVTSIGFQAFSECNRLRSVTIPGSATSIAPYSFTECSSLKTVTLSESVKNIDDVFQGTRSIQVLIAPGVMLDNLKYPEHKIAATVGYLSCSEQYKAPAIVKAYHKYIPQQTRQILSILLELDLIQGLMYFAATNLITAENCEDDFLLPAIAANATQCVTFLMDWKKRHMSKQKNSKKWWKKRWRI